MSLKKLVAGFALMGGLTLTSCPNYGLHLPFNNTENIHGTNVSVRPDEHTHYARSLMEFQMLPTIFYNQDDMMFIKMAPQHFVMYHEEGHHKLGHLFWKEKSKKMEVQADCYAKIKLINEGTTEDQFEDVEEFIVFGLGKSRFFNSGLERLNYFKKCPLFDDEKDYY